MEAKLRGALVKAVEVIRQWHGMGIPKKQEHELWTIYWRNAPEMTQIREALSDDLVSKNTGEKA
jgi:hypothetical protein